mmetsp:Transcript_11850/g.28952  ORF Transcript_11850/g.28952 Transcript_11850/m.28952 type:complete len:375 (-) Transcript_11850:201-1325(-)
MAASASEGRAISVGLSAIVLMAIAGGSRAKHTSARATGLGLAGSSSAYAPPAYCPQGYLRPLSNLTLSARVPPHSHTHPVSLVGEPGYALPVPAPGVSCDVLAQRLLPPGGLVPKGLPFAEAAERRPRSAKPIFLPGRKDAIPQREGTCLRLPTDTRASSHRGVVPQALSELAARTPAGFIAFEFGTSLGLNAFHMGYYAPPGVAVLTLDKPPLPVADASGTDEGPMAPVHALGQVFRNASDFVRERIFQLVGDSTSLDVSNLRRRAAFVWINGGHSEETCLSDSLNALQMVAPGGWVMWDCYSKRACPGVVRCLDGLFHHPTVRQAVHKGGAWHRVGGLTSLRIPCTFSYTGGPVSHEQVTKMVHTRIPIIRR